MQNFGEYNMWLAAENGMFLRLTTGEWMTTMPENLNMDWVDSVKVSGMLNGCFYKISLLSSLKWNADNCIKLQQVFEYFTERTPRSHFELRETSVVWNYKYAGI